MFIAIEGCDGSGKGVQIEKLKSWFESEGKPVEFFHDPGCTKLGDSVRALLLENSDVALAQRAETALFMASRAQLVVEKILPALKARKTVIVDRFLLSTVVYQGYAYKAPPEGIEAIWEIGAYMANGVLPELTFVLDCSVERAMERLNRPKDRIEQRAYDYHKRVVGGYRDAVRNWGFHAPGRAFLINAEQTPDEVFADLLSIVKKRLPSSNARGRHNAS